MGEAEQEEKLHPGRKNRRQPMTKEALESQRLYVARIREEIALETEIEALQGAKAAVRTLKQMAANARDERARYSAAAKIVDIVMPKSTGPLVNLSFGNNYISHLGLPPPPERPNALPGIIERGLLPEPQIMPRQITAEEPMSVTKIVPEGDNRGRFSPKTIDIEASFRRAESVPEALPAPNDQPRREIAELPKVTKFVEGE
jgi:hypothetical protein